MGPILGIDYGLRKIGIAISDPDGHFAFSRHALFVESVAEAVTKTADLVTSEKVNGIVIGLPFNADRTEGEQAKHVRAFVRLLEKVVPVPITLWDERASTQAVHREQRQAGRELKPGQEDSLAAQLILEAYLQEYHS